MPFPGPRARVRWSREAGGGAGGRVRSRARAQPARSGGGRGALSLSPFSRTPGPSAALQVRSPSRRVARGCRAAESGGGHRAHFPGSAAHAADQRAAGVRRQRVHVPHFRMEETEAQRSKRGAPWEGHPAMVRAGRRLTPRCPARDPSLLGNQLAISASPALNVLGTETEQGVTTVLWVPGESGGAGSSSFGGLGTPLILVSICSS